MEKNKEVLTQDYKKEIIRQIALNLAESNPNITVDENSERIYFIEETNSNIPISLGSLKYIFENEIDMNVEFQRDSNDHKLDTPQQIISDYCSGQFMGNITLWDSPYQQKKAVIDGRHRLSHLYNFVEGKLILENDTASKFWTQYLSVIYKLLDKKGDTELNKLISDLKEPKLVNSKDRFAKSKVKAVNPVDFTKLPKLIQDAVISKVKITSANFAVQAIDFELNPVNLARDDQKSMMIAFTKFYRMNNHSAKMTPDDNLWGMDSEYNEQAQRMANFISLGKLFDIKSVDKKGNSSQDEKKKLNEMLVSLMTFLDKKFPWGGSSNKLVQSVATKEYMKKMSEESKKFDEFFSISIDSNFKRMFSRGQEFDLPNEFKGIKSGNLTNIRQFTLFLYLLHKMVQTNKDFVMYAQDLPTQMTKSVIDLGAKIIAVSVFNKNGEISQDKLDEYGLQTIYSDNVSVFHKIAEFRKNQRSYNDMIPLYESLVNLCIDYTC